MAQQLLDGTQVCSRTEHVGRKSVPESMRMNLQFLRKPADMMVDNMPDAAAGQPPHRQEMQNRVEFLSNWQT